MDVKGGPGNAVTNGFSYLLKSLKVKPRRASATVGFHSLRKTVVQQLQGTALPEERRRALVGHEDGGDDVHRTVYMREWHAEEVAAFFPGLPWAEWLNITALKRLLSCSQRHPTALFRESEGRGVTSRISRAWATP